MCTDAEFIALRRDLNRYEAIRRTRKDPEAIEVIEDAIRDAKLKLWTLETHGLFAD
jgi:hypothetical protein